MHTCDINVCDTYLYNILETKTKKYIYCIPFKSIFDEIYQWIVTKYGT